MAQEAVAFNIDYYDDEDVWVNAKTGEIRRMPPKQVHDNEPVFIKTFKKEYEPIAMSVVGKESLVLTYIVFHMNLGDNILKATYKTISNKTNVSMRTVAYTMAKLQKMNFIRYITDGQWIVNPYMVMSGDKVKKKRIYAKFCECS